MRTAGSIIARAVTTAAFLLTPVLAGATPLQFENVEAYYVQNLALGTSNFHHVDSFSDGSTLSNNYRLGFSMQNFALDATSSLPEWILAILSEPLSNITSNMQSSVRFLTILRLTGDAGASAWITGHTFVDGYSNMQVLASPSANVASLVGAEANLSGHGTRTPQLDRSRNWVDSHSDSSTYYLGHDDRAFAPFQMQVGDQVTVWGEFALLSTASLNDYPCIPFIGCLPGLGWAASQTIGSFGVHLDIAEIPSPEPIPEPTSLALIVIGLVVIVLSRGRKHFQGVS